MKELLEELKNNEYVKLVLDNLIFFIFLVIFFVYEIYIIGSYLFS